MAVIKENATTFTFYDDKMNHEYFEPRVTAVNLFCIINYCILLFISGSTADFE